jgi:hypothetical protein
MEELTDILQFTATGTYSRGAIYQFANYLGYTELVELSPTESVPNPLTRVEFVQAAIRKMLIDKMAEMVIVSAKETVDAAYELQVNQLTDAVKADVAQGVVVSVDTVTQ